MDCKSLPLEEIQKNKKSEEKRKRLLLSSIIAQWLGVILMGLAILFRFYNH